MVGRPTVNIGKGSQAVVAARGDVVLKRPQVGPPSLPPRRGDVVERRRLHLATERERHREGWDDPRSTFLSLRRLLS